MSLTKANIIKAVQQATGIAPAIDKVNGTYYWRGEEINTSPSRPIEPHSAGEDPETWADIAQWESDRADKAEAIASKLDKELARLQRVINGKC